MTFTSLHLGMNEDNLPLGERRVVFANGQNNNNRQQGQQITQEKGENADGQTSEDLNLQRNKRFLTRINQLKGRNAITGVEADAATELLKSNNGMQQLLARRLANGEIEGDEFMSARRNMTHERTSVRDLTGRFINAEIDAATYQSALDDLDENDDYLKPLAQRLARGQVEEEEYDAAINFLGMDHDGTDEGTLAQRFALGQISAVEFRTEMAALDHPIDEPERVRNNAVENVQKQIHNEIVYLLEQVDLLVENLPERERTRPIMRMLAELRRLNNEDMRIRNGLFATLRVLQEDHGLSDEHRNTILAADFASDEEERQFRGVLRSQMNLASNQIDGLMTHKHAERMNENNFLHQVKGWYQLIEASSAIAENEERTVQITKNLSKITGIKLDRGQRIQHIHPDEVHGNVKGYTIKEINQRTNPLRDREGNVINDQVYDVDIIVQADDGSTETYTGGRFIKWVDATDAAPVVKNLQQLNERSNLASLGLQYQDGQRLEYTAGVTVDQRGRVDPNRQPVAITSINDNEVTLSQPVTTLHAEAAPHARLTADRQAQTMTLGEFEKWANRNDVIPQVRDLNHLNELLAHHNTHVNNTHNRNAEHYPPIRAERGQDLQYGDDTSVRRKISKADDDGIRFLDGETMTPTQFLNWVRSEDVENSNSKVLADRAAAAAGRLGADEEEQNIIREHKKGFFDDWDFSFGGLAAPQFKKNRPYGPVKEIWNQYTWVSMADVINMGKEVIEFVKRKHNRNSKHRYSSIGKDLPFPGPLKQLNTEFDRVNQSAETEEVNQYKEAISDWGTWDIMEKLQTTNNKDEAKACFISLSDKGELRWDDKAMWSMLNRLTAKHTGKGASLFIHLTDELQRDPETGIMMSGEDRTKAAIDAIWGDSTWHEWFSKNVSSYNSAKSAYESKAKQIEHDPKGTGGLQGELERLLREWKEGKYVNPHEYEELVDFSIMAGKLSVEDKIFYLMEGLTAAAPSGPMKGMTLLHLDRVGDIEGKYLNSFPLLDFFTNKGEKPFHPDYLSGKVDEPPSGGYKVKDLQSFREHYYKKESDVDCKSGEEFSRFMWEWMIVDPGFKKRLSKGLNKAEGIDHDDAHVYIPAAAPSAVEKFTGSVRGNQNFFTAEGYMNGYPGFNQYLVSLSNRHDELMGMKQSGNSPLSEKEMKEALKETTEAIATSIQSYIKFDAYMDARLQPTERTRARLDSTKYNEKPVNDPSFTVGQHKKQLDNMIKEICKAYEVPKEIMDVLYKKPDLRNKKEIDEIGRQLEYLMKTELPQRIEDQGADKILEIIQRRKMRAAKNGGDDPWDENGLRGIAHSNRLVDDKKAQKDPNA